MWFYFVQPLRISDSRYEWCSKVVNLWSKGGREVDACLRPSNTGPNGDHFSVQVVADRSIFAL